MAKILLIAPPMGQLYGKVGLKRFAWGCLPYGLASIAGLLKREKHAVRLVDATYALDNLRQLENLILEEKPEFVGISAVTPLVNQSLRICRFIKENLPQAKTILGGPHPSALPEETAAYPQVDMVVFGEGEYTLAQIAAGTDLAQIKGLCYKTGGEIKKNPGRPLIEDLDSLPLPLYEQLPISRYGLPHLGRAIGIITARGCPHSCSFCAASLIHGHRPRFRSVKYVLEEISYLKNKFSVNRVFFGDDTFETDPERIFELCRQLIGRRMNIKWSCTCRANGLPEDLLKIMKASGCELIHVGIESGNQGILDQNSKGIKLGMVEETVRRAKKTGIQLYGYFMIGLPYETEETISETIKLSQKLDLDYAQFSMFVPLPGTAAWKLREEPGVLTFWGKDWSDFKRYGKEALIELEHVSRLRLKKYYQMAYRGFYLRPKYIWKNIKKIRSFADIWKIIKLIQGMLLFGF